MPYPDSNSPTPYLSVVIPAYNEEERLPATIDAVIHYLNEQSYSWELLIVDDGSADDTIEVACQKAIDCDSVRVVSRPHLWKAATVRAGVLAASGEHVLFTDADLSTPIGAVEQLLGAIGEGFEVAIGSREGATAQRLGEPGYRHLMGRIFNWMVRVLAVGGINDTQCGFKLFTRDAADYIFPRLLLHQSHSPLHGPRVSAFDVEILFIAQRAGMTIAEVPVVWTHVPGSKVRPGIDAIRMFVDVLTVRLNAIRGKYN